MLRKQSSWGIHVAWIFFALTGTSLAAAAADIEEKTSELEATMGSAGAEANEKVRALEAAIKRGKEVSTALRAQIQALQSEKNALIEEKRALEKIQVVLTSGLIGALVTALVAILGVASNFARGRAERDLKRLEVLEKSVELEGKGLPVPDDIRTIYKARNPTA